jgi:cell division protein FtsA
MPKSIILTAIDIGTSSTKILVGEKELNSSEFNILAKEKVPQFGLRRGEIYNPAKVTETLLALKEKIQSNGLKIKKSIVGIGGTHLSVHKGQGFVSTSRADGRISDEDVQRVLQTAQSVSLPPNSEIIDVSVKEFIVDNQRGIKEPVGLKGLRLESKVLLISAFSPILGGLEDVVEGAGFEIEDIIPSPLACSRAILNSGQKELGAGVIDIGNATTSLSVFKEGSLIDFAIFPIGSSNITNDIAIGLRTEIAVAERIKKEFNIFQDLKNKVKNKSRIFSQKVRDKKEKIQPKISVSVSIAEEKIPFSQSFLKQIIKARTSEMFLEIAKELKKVSKDIALPAGVILTGGGSALPGLTEFAKQKLELPCGVSGPKGIPGTEEMDFSTAAGLLLSGFDLIDKEILEKKRDDKEGIGAGIRKIFKIFLP